MERCVLVDGREIQFIKTFTSQLRRIQLETSGDEFHDEWLRRYWNGLESATGSVVRFRADGCKYEPNNL